MESTVSFDVSLMGREASGETSSTRAFPLAGFLLILLIPADESDRNSMSGEIECEPVVINGKLKTQCEKNRTSRLIALAAISSRSFGSLFTT
jgi:hypothetical protein